MFEEVKQTWACFDDEAGRAVRAKAVGKVGLRLSSVKAIYTGLFFSAMRQRTGGLLLSRNSQNTSRQRCLLQRRYVHLVWITITDEKFF